MSKKKHKNEIEPVATIESIERFSDEILRLQKRVVAVVEEMRRQKFPSLDRPAKRMKAIAFALGQYTRGLEGAIERSQEDVDESKSTQLRVAENSEPFESGQKKTDTK